MRNFYFTILTLTLVLLIGNTWAQTQRVNLSSSNAKNQLEVISKSSTNLTLLNSISNFAYEILSLKGENYINISAQGFYKSNAVGLPNLPEVHKLIEIPFGSEIRISVIDYDEEVIELSSLGITDKILPVQESYSKSEDPDSKPFRINDQIFSQNDFYSKDLIEIEEVGISRGVHIGRLIVNPFSYNPVTNELKVKTNLIFKIEFENADLSLTRSMKQQFYSPAFNSVFETLLTTEQASTKDGIVDYGPVKYIIVANRMFETALQPFIEWKTLKGFNVIVAYTDVIGTTTSNIKSYLQDQYENPSDGISPSYILFVGDNAQIPAWNSTNSGSGGTDHVSDLYYAEYTGDYIPEVYYGRFSANSVAELTPQIDKTIEYERYEMADPSFLNEAVLVAGVDSYGNSESYGNGQIYYAINEYFNSAHGYTDVHTYLYGSGSPITSDDNAAPAAIHQNVSDGVGFVNYTAHCDWNGWADPSFDVDDIDDLTNDGMYSLMIGNCCRSNRFNTTSNGGTCFGEKIMRAENAGVIGYIGGSDYTYWDEDFYWGVGVDQIGITSGTAQNHTYENTGLGAYDGAFHENGEAESDWYVTSGQMMYVGNLAVTEGGSSYVHYYWEIYHLMGDPSLMAYYTVPSALTATHSSSEPVGITTYTVNTNTPGSYVAISKDGVLLDAQLANSSGVANLSFSAITTIGTVDIVATHQNRAPYIGTLEIILGTEPPVADFTADQTVIWENETVNFTDLSTQAPNTWAWNFGDSESSDIQHPSHTYTTHGTYTVSLVAGNNIGQSAAEAKTNYITVNAVTTPPIVDFIADQTSVYANEVIQFTDLTTVNPTTWEWNFGDGSATSFLQNPTHSYSASGFYTVSLTAWNSIGQATETKTDYIEVLLEDYCDAASTGTFYENITNVSFNTINNNSGSDGYADYTSTSTDVTIGNTYIFSVSYDRTYSTDQVLVWIDWNRNHIFETSEKYEVANGSGANSPYTYSINVPTNASLGSTLMRVRLHDTGSGANYDPCGDASWGEVEDYTINIVSVSQNIETLTAREVFVFPNPTSGVINIKGITNQYEYSIISVDGRVLTNKKVNDSSQASIDVSNLTHGVYQLVINLDDRTYNFRVIIE
ncbi:MAG: PKD domain-containing protein [Bacteroidales bacterium]|nr:PKD domain-containing protein [Bacteroidales bacterium]